MEMIDDIAAIPMAELLKLRKHNEDKFDLEIRYRDYTSMRGSDAADKIFSKGKYA